MMARKKRRRRSRDGKKEKPSFFLGSLEDELNANEIGRFVASNTQHAVEDAPLDPERHIPSDGFRSFGC